MPEKQPQDSKIFESRAERAKREPIFYFTTTEKDPQTGEEYEKKWVSVLGIELEVYDQEREGGEGNCFKESEFKDFLFDDKAKAILKHLAIAVKLGHAPLIEGETDIGKTKALEYLAYLTNHKLFRLSVRGTTDPSEFFGKHVPGSMTVQQKIVEAIRRKPGLTKEVQEQIDKAKREKRSLSLDDLRVLVEKQSGSFGSLKEESRKLFQRAVLEGRGLKLEEWKQLASIEGIDLEEKMFVWEDGEIVKAMQGNSGRGYWLYLDEIGAAEPQILIAINRVLEQLHRIELSEDGGRFVEAGEHFRFFATTNPPEYAGRLSLAPDFLRRWAYVKESSLNEKTVRERFAFILGSSLEMQGLVQSENKFLFVVNECPLEKEILDIFIDIIPAFYFSLRQSTKEILKQQKQKFNFEFSDLIRIRDFLKVFGYKDPLGALKEAMKYAVFNKIGNESERQIQEQNFETLLATKNIAIKVEEIIKRRNLSENIGNVTGDLDDEIANF